jgi:hypothetical protein
MVMGSVVVGRSMSVDSIASGTEEEDFWAVHEAVLRWVFELRSWRTAQGMDGGVDNTDSKIRAEGTLPASAPRSSGGGCSTSATRTGVRTRHSTSRCSW